jgi:hypothetical protein
MGWREPVHAVSQRQKHERAKCIKSGVVREVSVCLHDVCGWHLDLDLDLNSSTVSFVSSFLLHVTLHTCKIRGFGAQRLRFHLIVIKTPLRYGRLVMHAYDMLCCVVLCYVR